MRSVCLTAAAAFICIGAAAHAEDDSCTTWSAYTPPAVGTVFAYSVRHRDEDIPIHVVRSIAAIDGEDIEYGHHFESTDGSRPDSPPRFETVGAGMFPRAEGIMDDGSPVRSRTYDQPLIPVIESLEPGGIAILGSRETSSMNDRTRTITAPFTVVFSGCDTINVDGTDEPVRIYDVVYTARTYVAGRRPEADMASEKQNRYYMSERYGWPLRIDSATGHIQVVDISSLDSD